MECQEQTSVSVWHVVSADSPEVEPRSQLLSMLTAEERARAERFRVPRSRFQFVVGRVLLRTLLAEQTGLPRDRLPLQFAEHGKPYLALPEAPQFNIAHTEGCVICAISRHDPIGIDVEPIDRNVSLGLAERYFSAPEIAWLEDQPAGAQRLMFLRIWTLKESYIKALGTGLSMSLDQFAFRDIAQPRPRLELLQENPDAGSAWQCEMLPVDPRFFVALTVRASQRPVIRVQPFDLDSI